MTDDLTIALAQLNPTVGDIDGNVTRIRAARRQAARQGADLVVCAELVVCGYPPEDLVLKPAFQERCAAAVAALAADTGDGGPALLVGSPWRENGKLYNAALLLADGGRGSALQMQPAELRRLRRSGSSPRRRRKARWAFAACASASWCARTCGSPTSPSASRNPAPRY
jgi:hypothetical protein